MDHATQVHLIDRVFDMIDRRTTEMDPAEYHNPVSRYTDPERYKREVEIIFRRNPIIVAHGSELPKPGDYKTMDVTGVPILLGRTQDVSVNAFVNACRHRGTKLVWEECGSHKRSFVCPYHAWTYGTDGKLVGVPAAEGFPNMKREEMGLRRLHCAERYGFVFVQVDPTAPKVDVDAWLGPMAHELEHIGTADYVVWRPAQLEKKTNWKLALDTFLENYHTRRTHTKTIWPVFLDNTAAFDRLSPHARVVLPKRSIPEIRDQDRETWNLRDHSTVLYTIFPNLMLAVLPDHCAIFQVWPDGIDNCKLPAYTLVPPKYLESATAQDIWSKSMHVVFEVTEEDSDRSEAIQAALNSGANDHFVFGRYEQALAWFHQEVEAMLNGQADWVRYAEAAE